MIGYIKGKISSKGDGNVIVETGGIGYIINVPDNSPLLLASEGEDVKVHTQMIVREDDMSLYGFFDKGSVQLFNKLLTVSGVGAKAALSILSVLQPDELVKAITFGDAPMLTRANGIGKKSAERIILELEDKLSDFGLPGTGKAGTPLSDIKQIPDNPRAEAIEAMINFGYTKSIAASAVLSIEDNDLTTEEYLTEALQSMSK